MSKQSIECWKPRTTAIVMLVLLTSACSEQQSSAPPQTQTSEAPVEQVMESKLAEIMPVPAPAAESAPAPEPVVAAAASGDASDVGESIYQKACKSCHDLGVANAPKLGDSAAWAPRIAQGNDTLFQSVMKGLRAMPPKGACMSCSDDELRSAMEYMVAQGS